MAKFQYVSGIPHRRPWRCTSSPDHPDVAGTALPHHSIWSASTQRPNTAEPEQGPEHQSSGDSVAPLIGHVTSTLSGDALHLAGTGSLKPMAIDHGKDAPGNLAEDTTGQSSGQAM